MPFVPIPKTAEVAMRYQQDSQIVVNVWHVFNPDGWDAEGLTQLGEVFRDWNENTYRFQQSNTVTLTEIVVRDLTSQTAPGVVVPVLVNGTGSIVGNAMPNSVTVCAKLATGLSGRSYRGRKFHIGLVEDEVIANKVTIPKLQGLQTAYTTLMGDLASLSLALVVVSKVSLGQPRSIGLATPVLAVSIDPVVDVQRRRLPGRGR